jgi:hypothetical protein
MLGKRQTDFLVDVLLNGCVWYEGCGYGPRNVEAIRLARRLEALGLLVLKPTQERLEWHVVDKDLAWHEAARAGVNLELRDRAQRIEEARRQQREAER